MTPHYPHSRRPRVGKALIVVIVIVVGFLCLCSAGLFLAAVTR
jgi:hypothetical protein